MEAPSPRLIERLRPLFGARHPIAWRRVERGYTQAQRWVVTLDDGSACFVKAGDEIEHVGAFETTAHGLRKEHNVYAQVRSAHLPRMLFWHDDPELTLLGLDDLTDAFWPPPWTQRSVDAVLEAMTELHSLRIEGLSRTETVAALDEGSWRQVSLDPREFLALGLCTQQWLEAALALLVSAEQRVPMDGNDFCHFDLRSDNLCFIDGVAKVIDWNWASQGNGDFDIAFWLPSLAAEGCPLPETILPNAAEYAALVSGFFAARAGRPAIPALPRVREVQLSQLETALPWAVRALGLPPLDGPNAPS